MKNFLALLTLSLLCLTADVFGQASVTITPKKMTYTRRGVEKHKRTFTITYPVVGGALTPAVKTRLENTISYWRVFETTLKENLSGTWLYNMEYEVKFNRNGILVIELRQEGSAAYPDQQIVNLVVDLKTGEQVKFADVFNADAKFAEMVNQKLTAEKQELFKVIDEDKEQDAESKTSLKEQVGGLEFTAETFNEFRVSDKGVTILYDAEFPHVIQALQPNGEYFFTYAELKPFIKKEGLLGRFVK